MAANPQTKPNDLASESTASQRWNQVTRHQVSDFGQVGSLVSVSHLVFDPVLSFSMHFYRGIVSTE